MESKYISPACVGFCANGQEVKGWAYQLLSIAQSRKKILHNPTCEISAQLSSEFEIRYVNSLMLSLAVHIRLWFDQFDGTDGLPNPQVCERLDGSHKGQKSTLKQACSFVAHSVGMWFKPIDDEAEGTEVIIEVPKEGKKGYRHYAICLRDFACGSSALVNHCPDCAGFTAKIHLDENYLPLYDDEGNFIYEHEDEESPS